MCSIYTLTEFNILLAFLALKIQAQNWAHLFLISKNLSLLCFLVFSLSLPLFSSPPFGLHYCIVFVAGNHLQSPSKCSPSAILLADPNFHAITLSPTATATSNFCVHCQLPLPPPIPAYTASRHCHHQPPILTDNPHRQSPFHAVISKGLIIILVTDGNNIHPTSIIRQGDL